MRRAVWLLARPGNVALGALGVVVGGVGAAGYAVHWDGVAFAAAAAMLGVAGGNALNDALDAPIDRAAHPRRAIPQGLASSREAARWAAAWILLALGLAWAANFWVLLVATLLVANLLLYEFAFKARGLFGHVLVSYNAGGLFLLGGLAALAPALTYGSDALTAIIQDDRLVAPLVMAVLAGTLNFARELYKAAEDAPHDAAVRRTFAVRAGAQGAKRAGDAAAWATILVAVAPWALGYFDDVYVVALVPLLALLLVVPFVGGPRTAQVLLKAGMVLGFVPFLATALI